MNSRIRLLIGGILLSAAFIFGSTELLAKHFQAQDLVNKQVSDKLLTNKALASDALMVCDNNHKPDFGFRNQVTFLQQRNETKYTVTCHWEQGQDSNGKFLVEEQDTDKYDFIVSDKYK